MNSQSTREHFPMSEEEFAYPSDLDDSLDAFPDGDSDESMNWFEDAGETSHSDHPIGSLHSDSNPKAYEVMSPTDILHKQHEAMQAVHNILPGYPLVSVRVLLHRHNWDGTRLLGALMEDPERTCRVAGVPPPTEEEKTQVQELQENAFCQICMEESDLYALACGHAFCRSCWAEYLAIEVKERRPSIVCCASGCTMVIDELVVLDLLKDETLKKVYENMLLSSFVENNPRCCWCPAPDCGRAILLHDVLTEGNESVRCQCGFSFCFRCLGTDHRPCDCDMLKDWLSLYKGDSATLDEGYVAAHARLCPKCRSPIEKNQGCNHITCKCGFHFCWKCMQKFGTGPMGGSDGYRNHKCSVSYEEDENTKSKRAELERYRHYCERFEAHGLSAKLEVKMLRHEEQILGRMKHEGFIGNDFSPAVKQTVENRNALRYSYVFGYYRAARAPFVNKGIFENLQLDLERHTELLSRLTSEFSEHVCHAQAESKESIDERRQAVVNQTRIGAKVLGALFDASSAWAQQRYLPSSLTDHDTLLDVTGDSRPAAQYSSSIDIVVLEESDPFIALARKNTKEKKTKTRASKRTSSKREGEESVHELASSPESSLEDVKPKKKKRRLFGRLTSQKGRS